MPIPKKVLLIINPIAGDTDKTRLLDLLDHYSIRMRFSFEVFRTTGTGDEAAVEQSITEFQPNRILVAGGDGTITQMANVVRKFNIPLGILPMGSANGLAISLGLPSEIDEAMEVALGDNIIQLDGMLINDRLGLHLSDLGLNARLIKNYEEGHVRGKWGYLSKVAQTLTEHDVFSARISTDTETFETEATIIILANANMYGTGVIINPKGSMTDGRFEVIIATRFDLIELAKIVVGSTDFDPEVVRILTTTHAKIECLSGDALFQIDGELQGVVNQINASILPGILRVVIPEK